MAKLNEFQLKALFDILTHNQAYKEFTLTKIPGRVSCSGFPFSPGPDTPPQDPSPGLNYLFRELALSLPGFKTITPEIWQQGAQGLLERLAAQDLSDSYDKGVLGKRKILGQGVIVIAEFALRGVLGGLPRRKYSSHPKDPRECNYNPKNPQDVSNAWNDFLQGLVYQDFVSDLVSYVEKTDNLNDLPTLYQSAHAFASATLASFLHYLFTKSPCAASTVSLISRVHSLLPYSLVGAASQVANAATMISGVLKIFLSRSPLNMIGFGSGNNLLQTIITSVLGKDKSNLQKQWQQLEKKETGITNEQKEGIMKYVNESSREERIETRNRSIEAKESIVITILNQFNIDLPKNEEQHTTLLTQLTLNLAIRDRIKLIDALVNNKPDLVTLCVTEAMNAFEPLIRKLHKSVDLKESLDDLKVFIDDLVKIAQDQLGPRSYIELFDRHQKNLHKFLHNLVKNAPEMKEMYLGWYKHCLDNYRTSTNDECLKECGSAGDFSSVLQSLFDELDEDVQQKVIDELNSHAEYQYNVSKSSKEKLSSLIDLSKEQPNIGPGVFIAVWQDMIDKNPITPVTMFGPVRHGADKGVQQASKASIEINEEIAVNLLETRSRSRAEPLYGEGTVRPDCDQTIKALEQSFDMYLRKRHGFI